MKNAVLTLGLVTGLAAPAPAQWLGVPVWNLVELGFVVAGKPRTGDRIAGTVVTEE